MKRPRQHEIDEDAQTILRVALPKAWVCEEYDEDYAKDFSIELVEEGDLTGKVFIIQLKGKERLRMPKTGSHISHSLETRYVRYYADKIELPVFVVVADIANRRAYWLFIQQFVDEELTPKNSRWREQKSITLSIPIENEISDTHRLRSAVIASLAYMKKKYPGTIGDAIAVDQKRIESLDPRFDVDLSVQGGQVAYSMRAKELVHFNVQVAGPKEAVEGVLREAFETGKSVDLASLDVSVSGMPVLSQSGKILGMQIWKELPMEVRIALLGNDPSSTVSLDPVTGNAIGGTKTLHFSEPLGNSGFIVQVTVTKHDAGDVKWGVGVGFRFSMEGWQGRTISMLPYFDQISRLIHHVRTGGILRWTITSNGNPLVPTIEGPMARSEPVDQASNAIDILKLARDVAKRSGIDPMLPETITEVDVQELVKLANLLDPAPVPLHNPDQEIPIAVPRERVVAELARGESGVIVGEAARVTQRPQTFVFLGVPVEVFGIEVEISAVRMQQSDAELRAWLESTRDPVGHFTLRAMPGAVITRRIGGVRRLPPNESPAAKSAAH